MVKVLIVIYVDKCCYKKLFLAIPVRDEIILNKVWKAYKTKYKKLVLYLSASIYFWINIAYLTLWE